MSPYIKRNIIFTLRQNNNVLSQGVSYPKLIKDVSISIRDIRNNYSRIQNARPYILHDILTKQIISTNNVHPRTFHRRLYIMLPHSPRPTLGERHQHKSLSLLNPCLTRTKYRINNQLLVPPLKQKTSQPTKLPGRIQQKLFYILQIQEMSIPKLEKEKTYHGPTISNRRYYIFISTIALIIQFFDHRTIARQGT